MAVRHDIRPRSGYGALKRVSIAANNRPKSIKGWPNPSVTPANCGHEDAFFAWELKKFFRLCLCG